MGISYQQWLRSNTTCFRGFIYVLKSNLCLVFCQNCYSPKIKKNKNKNKKQQQQKHNRWIQIHEVYTKRRERDWIQVWEWKNPNGSSSWVEWRLGNRAEVKDIPLQNEHWSLPVPTLWKILARCWGCTLSPLPSFYIILAIINQSDSSPQSIYQEEPLCVIDTKEMWFHSVSQHWWYLFISDLISID